MGRGSFEAGGECISGLAQLTDCNKPISDWLALPITIGLSFLLREIGYTADCLVHGLSSDLLPSLLQQRWLFFGAVAV
jgi:hypothetical protein